jgi:hypothetical protein
MGEVVSLRLDLTLEQHAREANFDDFWTAWPKRVAKIDALKAWDKLTPAQRTAAIEALPAHIAAWSERGDPQFIPYPATWIRGQRWEDDLQYSLHTKPCSWRGCKKNGTVLKGAGTYCEAHIAALKRGETP